MRPSKKKTTNEVKIIPQNGGFTITVNYTNQRWEAVLTVLLQLFTEHMDKMSNCTYNDLEEQYYFVDVLNRAMVLKDFYDFIQKKLRPANNIFGGIASAHRITIKEKWLAVLATTYPPELLKDVTDTNVVHYHQAIYRPIFDKCNLALSAKIDKQTYLPKNYLQA